MTSTYPESPRGIVVGMGIGHNRLDHPVDDVTYTQISPHPSNEQDPGPVLGTIVVTRGRVGDAETTEPTKIETAVRNTDGTFTPRNPNSPHYGQLLDGTPLRVAVWVDEGGTPTEYVRATANIPTFLPVSDGWTDDTPPKALNPRVPITALGGLNRISLETVEESPLARFYALASSAPHALWPLDDDRDATEARTGVDGGFPMSYHGAVRPGSAVRPAGTRSATATLGDGSTGTDGYLLGQLPRGVFQYVPGLGGGSVTFDFSVAVDRAAEPDGATSRGVEFKVTAGSDELRFSAVGTSYQVVLNGVSVSFTLAELTDGSAHHVNLWLASGTTDTDVTLTVDGVSDSDTIAGEIFTGDYWQDDGGVVRLSGCHYFAPLDEDLGWGPATWSYFAVTFNTDGSETSAYQAAIAYNGERADDRIGRLLAEFDIPSAVATSGGVGEPLGPQPTGPLQTILRDAEAADHGVLYETVTGLIDYLPRLSLLNQTPITVTFAQTSDLIPVQSNKYNIVKADGESGGSATAEITAGEKGTTAIGPSRYDARLNVDPDRLAEHARWMACHASVEEYRWIVVLDLRLTAALRALGLHSQELIGKRIKVTGTPVDDTGGELDLLIAGYPETLGADVWKLALHCDPYEPFNVGEIGSGRLGPPAGLTITEDLDATETDVTVSSAVFSSTAVPYDIEVEGERMTVTNVSGTTITVTRSANGVVMEHDSGAAIDAVTEPLRLTLGDPA